MSKLSPDVARSSPELSTNLISSRLLVALFLVSGCCVVLAFFRIIPAYFVSDDFDIILSVVRDGPLGIWSGHGSNFFRPAFAISIFADHAIWGLDPRGYHATNLLIHALCSFLVAVLAVLLADGAGVSHRRAWVAGLAAGPIFAILPTHVEPVNWISGRGDLLSCLFSLASILSFFGYLRGARVWSLFVAISATGIALLSKEAAVVLPLLIVVLVYGHAKLARDRVVVARRLPIALAAVSILFVYLLARWLVLGRLVGGYGTSVHTHFDLEVLGKLFLYFPSRILAPALGVTDVAGVVFPLNLVVLAVGTGIALISFFRGPKHVAGPHLLLVLGLMLILLLPVMNLSVVATTSEGTRFLYLPSTMAVLTVVLFMISALHHRVIVLVTLAILIPSVIFVQASSARWVEAGSLARKTVISVSKITGVERLWVLVVPDDLDGAYVLRNGIHSANRLLGGRDSPRRVVPVFRLAVAQAEVTEVERCVVGRYVLKVPDRTTPKGCLSQTTRSERSLLEIRELRANRTEVWIGDATANSVASWSRSGVQVLDCQPGEAVP